MRAVLLLLVLFINLHAYDYVHIVTFSDDEASGVWIPELNLLASPTARAGRTSLDPAIYGANVWYISGDSIRDLKVLYPWPDTIGHGAGRPSAASDDWRKADTVHRQWVFTPDARAAIAAGEEWRVALVLGAKASSGERMKAATTDGERKVLLDAIAKAEEVAGW